MNDCRLCAPHLKENAEHQSVAVLGIALTALGEDVGTEMCLRTFEHLLQVLITYLVLSILL